ncbi:MAG: 3'-5' exonuclease [Candidatus Omnitrophica bacterium]|nr:3'-5' exonuclease [Candidatus Omnitrophota bacterium]
MSWKTGSWLVLDTETTGVHDHDRIVELGMLVVINQQVALEAGTLVDPGIPIPEEASNIHGIYDKDVEGKPTLKQVALFLAGWCAQAQVMVGYNLPFDIRMLDAELGHRWRYTLPQIDPLTVVRLPNVGKWWKGKGRHKLEAAARHLDCMPTINSMHRATDDCKVTTAILIKLLDHLDDDASVAAEQIAAWRKEQDAEFEAWKARQPPLETQ